MWKNKMEWEIAKWMLTKLVSWGDLDDLFGTEMVSSTRLDLHCTIELTSNQFRNSSLSFRSTKQLFDRIEAEMESFGGPEWNFVEVPLAEAPNKKNVLVY
jgi:hypothetical protein